MASRIVTKESSVKALLDVLKISKFNTPYHEHFARASHELTMEDFWAEQAKLVDWFKEPTTILDKSNAPLYKWFKGGQLNISYNCVDRHAKERPNANALIYESPVTKTTKIFSYADLKENVSRVAGILQAKGITKGDRVIIYMPMVPEAVFAMLACARVGAVHSVVFGGFGGPELASRITDCKPKLIVTASCGIEPHAIVNYQKNLEEAVEIAGVPNLPKIVLQRPQLQYKLKKGIDFDFYDEFSKAKAVDAVPVDATDYNYVLYTSGTTGAPKGIVRDQGGNSVALSYCMRYLMDVHKGETFFSASDIGWVVGHSFIVYGPLLAGAQTILYEGKPVGTPDAGQFWRLTEKYKVKNLYTAPTALRTLRKEDPDGAFLKKYDLSSLKMALIVGERMDVPAYYWLRRNLPKETVVNDNYWQTETGWPISSNHLNLETFAERPGSCSKPVPGYQVTVVGEDGKPVPNGTLGKVCIKMPMPPNFMSTLYGNDKAFISKYLAEVPGYYSTGDAGYLDADGYLHVTTRIDDIINTAGHRLSTSQMEEVLTHHPDIVEAAVIGGKDEIKGEIPVGFIVLKNGVKRDSQELENECIKKVRHDIGPVASFKKCIVVDKLPKTRSGKIVRNVLRALVNGETPRIPPTIDDITVVDVIKKQIVEHGLGHEVDLKFEEDLKK